MRLLRLAGVGLLTACAPAALQPGTWGTMRHFGDLAGTVPLRLHPPVTDRQGNVYVAAGDRDRTDTAFIVGMSPARGLSSASSLDAASQWRSCAMHEGPDGLHGFVGRTHDRAWFWSGSALVAVVAEATSCTSVLDIDPVSQTDLRFVAVVPHLEELPARTALQGLEEQVDAADRVFLSALVQSAVDALPVHARIDLMHEQVVGLAPFPYDVDAVSIVGVGVDEATGDGIFVASMTREDAISTVAFGLDAAGALTFEVGLDETLEPLAIVGPLRMGAARGVGVGLLEDGRVLTFGPSGAAIVEVAAFEPRGVLAADGEVYLTGVGSGGSVLARVEDVGVVADPRGFAASSRAADALAEGVTVRDERSDPTRSRTWDVASSAIGPAPLVTPYAVDTYTLGVTGWLVAGPSFDNGIEGTTSVAFAPLGWAVP